MRANAEIREAVRASGVKMWELADNLHIADNTLSRRLRHELPVVERDRILGVVAEIALRKEAEKRADADH